MFSSGPKYQKLTTNLRLAINRLKLLEKKKTELAVKARQEISVYLMNGKEDRARIRVEHIVREDYLVEALEIIEMYCDLLLARMGLIQTTKEMDAGLEEPIASILWATPRLQAEVGELKVVSDQLTAKYGKEFALACSANQLNNVNDKLMHKLSVQAPPKILVEKYLEEIARTYNVPFEADPDVVAVDEVLAAEGMLINFDDKKGGRGGGGGGGGMRSPTGMPQTQRSQGRSGHSGQSRPPGSGQRHEQWGPPQQMPTAPPSYQPYPGAYPQPQGYPGAYPEPQGYPGAYPQPQAFQPMPPQQPPAATPFNYPTPAAPNTDHLYDANTAKPPRAAAAPPAPKSQIDDKLPELPSVPNTSLAPGSTSVGGESVDFDDLTKRFEELKKRK